MQRSTPPRASTRWWVLAGLVLARIAFGFQFQTPAAVAPGLIGDLTLDAVGLGTMIGMFMVPGIFLALPGGLLGQRLGEFSVLLFSLGAMTVGATICALAADPHTLWLGRFLAGIGSVLINVLMSKIVIDWFIDKELATAMSLYLAGYPAGIALALVSLGPFAATGAWPMAFWLSVALSTFALLVFAFSYRAADTGPAGAETKIRPSRDEYFMVAMAGLIWGIYNMAFLIMLSFVPLYLVGEGLSPTWATSLLGIGTWISILAMPLGGYIADRWNRPNLLIVSGMAVWGAAILLTLPLSQSPWLLAVLFAVTSIAGSLPIGSIVALVAEVIRPELRGLGMGIFYTWFYAAAAMGPILGGKVLDYTGVAEMPIIMVSGLTFLSLGVLALFRLLQARGLPRAVAPV